MKQIFICPKPECKYSFTPLVSNEKIQCPKCKFEADRTDFKIVFGKVRYCAYCGTKWIDYKHAETDKKGIIVCPNPKCGHEYHKTIFISDEQKNWASPGIIIFQEDPDGFWRDTKESFSLNEGINILGRDSSENNANIKFKTKDRYMSRAHLEITVRKNFDGTYTHSLRDLSTHGTTYINAYKIRQGQTVIIEPGSTLKLGHTVFAICDTTTTKRIDSKTSTDIPKTIPE